LHENSTAIETENKKAPTCVSAQYQLSCEIRVSTNEGLIGIPRAARLRAQHVINRHGKRIPNDVIPTLFHVDFSHRVA